MTNTNTIARWATVTLSMLLLTLGGCGGGGGSGGGTTPTPTPTPTPKATTLTGTAAAGAPVIGSVTIKDNSTPTKKEKTVAIAADGKYTVDVSDMTAPFAMRADGDVGGRKYHLYSAATQVDVGGTVNITPFTDLIISNISGDIASHFYDNNAYTTLTKADLDAAQTALKAKLQSVLTALGVGDSIDLLRTAFNADHKGLDSVLDVLKVTVDPTTKIAEIKNILSNEAITDDLNSKNDVSAFTTQQAAGLAAGLTDFQSIVKTFDDFSALFATSLPRSDNAQLLALFDQAKFLDDGQNLDAFFGKILTDPQVISLKFTDLSVVSLDPVAGTGEVTFHPNIQGKNQVELLSFKMLRTNTGWRMQGNQRIARARVEVQSNIDFNSNTSTPQIQTGFYLSVNDHGARGINKAIVTGPGLATGGVTLIKNIANSDFSFQQTPGQNSGNFVSMDDATVGGIPDTGASYTFELRDASNVILATYTSTIPKRPYKPSELTTASFPVITSPTLTAWRAFTGGNLAVTWTLPAGVQNLRVGAWLSGTSGSADVSTDIYTQATTSTTLTIQPVTSTGTSFTITNRSLQVEGSDGFGRRLQANFNN